MPARCTRQSARSAGSGRAALNSSDWKPQAAISRPMPGSNRPSPSAESRLASASSAAISGVTSSVFPAASVSLRPLSSEGRQA